MRREGAVRIFSAVVIGWAGIAGLVSGLGAASAQVKQNGAVPHYEITGVVVNSVGGDPVAHCRLTPTLTAGRGGVGGRQFPALGSPASGATNSVDCDAHGRFAVTVPSAGAWRLTASARGFVSQAYDEHQAYSSAIVLTAEAPTIDIEFRLSPEASIAGLVLDEAGEPVRNAQVTLQIVPPPTPGGPEPIGNTRGVARTDDRGMYELANLSPGAYRLSLHAQPWYAVNSQNGRGNETDSASLDPSLDFAYPVTWFPGVADAALAETIELHAGDTRQADFHLVPVPSLHMRILVPPRTTNGQNSSLGSSAFPVIQQMTPGAGQGFVQITTRYDQQGQIDVGGLTPGLYRVSLAGPNREGDSTLVEVSANSTRTVDLSAPPHDVAKITVHFDGAVESDSSSRGGRNGGLRVSLVDMDTHRGSFSTNSFEGGGVALARRETREPDGDPTIEVPPGRYEVVLQSRANLFLAGLTAKGAETSGRYVTVAAGESSLTVHVASGRASLSGIATMDGKPSVGAMILLVPITIEDRDSITVLRQDQTNTDGSFSLANVLPGQYILVAIDHGWGVNWGDPSTLRRYLMQGVPIELKSSAIVKQDVTAQAP